MDKEARTLLLDGFIREIKSLLVKDIIIPQEIVILCSLFFVSSRKIFFHLINKGISLRILDLHSKTISKLVENEATPATSAPTNFCGTEGFCYIQNISRYIKITNKTMMDLNPNESYDGIICVDQFSAESNSLWDYQNSWWSPYLHGFVEKSYPSIILFESNKIDEDTINYCKFTSSVPFRFVDRFLFCGEQHGIIYERNRELYQCKFEDIDLEAMDLKFMKICDDTFWTDGVKFRPRLRINYIQNDKIFAIEQPDGYGTLNFLQGDTQPPKLEDLPLKCAIFDLNTKTWREISHFICKRDEKYNGVFSNRRCICYDEYRINIVYVIGNRGDVSEYDLDGDKWKYWNMERKLRLDGHKCWMDDHDQHILYCSDGNWFGWIDIRKQDEGPEWVVMQDMMALATTVDYSTRKVASNRHIFL